MRKGKKTRRKEDALALVVAQSDPDQILSPTKCVNAACESRKFRFHQPVSKALRDTVYHQVQPHRYLCLKGGADLAPLIQ